ncbi:hypothetical protein C8R45DRAFT_1090949 [Mycena sanguinolenta]|nr:hypothetical protein C8R45DRAFT_1090949 [Mycena sanguinolenta]
MLFMQIFLADPQFSSLATRPLASRRTYRPAFAAYFLSQNAANAGIHLNLKSLGIGNGMADPASQYPFYPSDASYNLLHLLVPDVKSEEVNTAFYAAGGCASKIAACNSGGSDAVCWDDQSYCNADVLAQISERGLGLYVQFFWRRIHGINGILLSQLFSDYYVDGKLAGLNKNASMKHIFIAPQTSEYSIRIPCRYVEEEVWSQHATTQPPLVKYTARGVDAEPWTLREF